MFIHCLCIGDLEEHFTIFNGFCKQLKINATDISELFTLTITTFDQELHVLIADPESSTYFMFNPETLNGDIIEINKQLKHHYVIDIEEIQRMPESGECMMYGEGSEFKTYADCVADEHEQTFKPILGCLPPWLAAPDSQGRCRGKVPISKGSYAQSKKIIQQLSEEQIYNTMPQSQSCKKPCKEIKVNSKRVTSEKKNLPRIAIKIIQTVKV